MTLAEKKVKVNELRDAVIIRDGLEVKGTIAVCDYIEYMERMCGDSEYEEVNDTFVKLLLEIIEDYSEGGAL